MHRFTKIMARRLMFAVLLSGLSSTALAETVFNKGNGADPTTFDPQQMAVAAEAAIAVDLFEGLMTYDADGNAVPGAAESWAISDDGLTYTFKLRADGKWSDGTPVTAADFVFSWRRLVDPKTNSRYASFLWSVKNAEAISKGQKPLAEMGVAAPDPRTFVVTLATPVAYFLSTLTHSATYPVQIANVTKFGDEYVKPGNLVSNGAYRLVEAVPQGHVKLAKNPQFYAAASVAIDT